MYATDGSLALSNPYEDLLSVDTILHEVLDDTRIDICSQGKIFYTESNPFKIMQKIDGQSFLPADINIDDLKGNFIWMGKIPLIRKRSSEEQYDIVSVLSEIQSLRVQVAELELEAYTLQTENEMLKWKIKDNAVGIRKEDMAVTSINKSSALIFSTVMFAIALIATGAYGCLVILSQLIPNMTSFFKGGVFGLLLFGLVSIVIWMEGISKELKP